MATRKWKIVHPGFTLIELIVVFSIISIVSTVGLASFVSYSRSQNLRVAVSEVNTLLTQAKSRAQSQVKPASCGSSALQGYEVRICGLPTSTCSAEGTYELYVHCGALPTKLSTKTLPSSVQFSSTATTSTSYLFRVLQGGVIGNGRVALTGYGNTQTIDIGRSGTITAQ